MEQNEPVSFYSTPETTENGAPPQPTTRNGGLAFGGDGVIGHAKELCVNKMGHTMVPPPEEGKRIRFLELFWKHWLHTITYWAVFWSFGMCVAFLGPTFLDLECRISSVFSTMSWAFFSQSFFTLVGSAWGGFLVQRLGNHVVLFVSTVMLAVTLAVIPACRLLWNLALVLAIMGFFMGTIDTVANISMIRLYGRNVAPFLQALHFFYGLGAVLSPIVAEPFLLNKNCTHHTHPPLTLNSPNMTQPISTEDDPEHHSRIEYAFWILSGMQTPVVTLLAVVLLKETCGWGGGTGEQTVEALQESYEMKLGNATGAAAAAAAAAGGGQNPNDDDDGRPPVSREQVMVIVACTAVLLFLYDGIQAGYGAYIFSYASKSVHTMTRSEAAYLNACFWGTFAFGRLVSIGISTHLAPSFMLLCNITGCLFAMVLMLSFRHSHSVLYIGSCIFGTFLSSVYPTAVSLAETYINVTSYITSILVVCAAAGEMLMPVIIGHEMVAIGPASVLVSGLIMTLLSVGVYVSLYLVAQTITRHSAERSLIARIKKLLSGQHDEISEDSGLMKHHVKYYSRMKSNLSESSLGESTSRANTDE
ncbi:major facilitator superfamily domain-containing protein 4A-like [Oratosquilla oratoria]|uniref:major facilitator superfamily domain-containing protein 4A-like n=1 Tax=Oratosquilla oratoria TaxID=337810 RepID=UPI003F7640F0